MKNLLKIAAVFVTLLFILLLTAPFVFKDKLIGMAKELVNNEVNAKVDFEDPSLSLIRNFPDFSVKLNNITIDGTGAFESINLVKIEDAKLIIDIKSVFSEEYKVKGLNINGMFLNALILEDGRANYDILKDDFDSDPSKSTDDSYPYMILLEDYKITNSKIFYKSIAQNVEIEVNDLEHQGNGKLSDVIYRLNTTTEVKDLSYSLSGTKYLTNSRLEIDANFDITDEFRQYDLKENEVRLNNLLLNASGDVYMPEDGMKVNIQFNTIKDDLKTLLSLIPEFVLPELSKTETKGKAQVSGSVVGVLDDNTNPAFNINMTLENGYVKYPDLPNDINDLNLKMTIKSPQGKDFANTEIDIKDLRMKIAQSDLVSKMKITKALSDQPSIDLTLRANTDLKDLKNAIPLEDVKTLEGKLQADFKVKGDLTDIQNNRYSKVDASGSATLRNFTYSAINDPSATQISELDMNFTPSALNIPSMKGTLDKSKYSANGKINNYLEWFLNDEVIKGDFNFKADRIDLNNYMDEGTESSNKDQEKTETLEIPANIDIGISVQIDEVIYEDLKATNVAGGVKIKDQTLDITNLTMQLLDGTVGLKGKYIALDPSNPKIDLSYDISNMNIAKAAASINTIKALAPIAEKCVGNFNSKMKFSGSLNEAMEPVLSSLVGDGIALTYNLKLNEFELLNKITNTLKINSFAGKTLKDVNIQFAVKNGLVDIKPFNINISGIQSVVSGQQSLDGQMDYTMKMKVPFSILPESANSWLGSVTGKAKDFGVDPSLGDHINLSLKIGGTFTKPTLKPVFEGQEGKSIKEVIKEEATEKAKEAVNEKIVAPGKEKARAEADKILKTAQAQADKIKSEAKRAADVVRNEADKQASKLEAEAKNPLAKVAAKKAGDKIRQEANKKAAQIETEANQKADAIMNKARKEADEKLK